MIKRAPQITTEDVNNIDWETPNFNNESFCDPRYNKKLTIKNGIILLILHWVILYFALFSLLQELYNLLSS